MSDAWLDQAREVVRRANEVRIARVLQDLHGIHAPDEGSSFKTWCPFAFEHADPLDKNFRIYPNQNRCYCFAAHGGMNVVRLVEMSRDLRPVQAAQWVLNRYGIPAGVGWRERFEEMLKERETRESVGAAQNIVEAFHVALGETAMTGNARRLEERLEELDELLGRGAGEEEVRAWYVQARAELREAL